MDSRKSQLRNQIRAARIGIRSRFTLEPLKVCDEFRSARVIASYRSYGDEPATEDINLEILKSGRTLLLPRRDDGSIRFVSWDGNPNALELKNRIEEPIGPEFEGAIDLIIVPGLAADDAGNRLGQGGGFYDRKLSELGAWKVILLNENEVIDLIPVEPHDIKIDAILTPTQLKRIQVPRHH